MVYFGGIGKEQLEYERSFDHIGRRAQEAAMSLFEKALRPQVRSNERQCRRYHEWEC